MADGSPKRVLIAGGGVGALEAVLALRELAGDAVSIELVAPKEDFVFAPMSVAAPFERGGAARYPLADFAREQGLHLRRDAVSAIEPETRMVVTAGGGRVPYDVLLVAVGARPVPAVDGAVTFPGAGAAEQLQDVLAALEAGKARSVVFVVPPGTTWALPLYELALLAVGRLRKQGIEGATIHLATAEESPLAVFGPAVSEGVSRLLADRGIVVRAGVAGAAFGSGRLELAAGGAIAADRAVALPRLRGSALPGLPSDADGFIPIDTHCRVDGVDAVYAAGDATTFPLKQGGLAAQQADAAVEALAAELGLHDDPAPFRPVLRALLLTGDRPYYLRADLTGDDADSRTAVSPLWWPPVKVAGRLLAPYLATLAHSGTAVSGSELVDLEPDAREETTSPELDEIAALASALATVDVSWVTPTSLRPPPRRA
jgi:sulfide:quinone oxidoreductase